VWKMPIKRYVKEGVVFSPKVLSAMSQALEATAEILDVGRDEIKRQAIAKFIIRLAQKDHNLGAVALRDKAVAALGGVAYSAISRTSQTSDSRDSAE
jgi:hypothetical protein